MKTCISPLQLSSLLAIEDLTQNSSHCIAQMVDILRSAISSLYPDLPIHMLNGPAVVNADHNYRLLGYPTDNITQSNIYTKWVDEHHMLRTQTTSLILEYVLRWRHAPHPVVLLAPGMVHRRDVRDRWHCAQPHQIDIWVLGVPATPQTIRVAMEALSHSAVHQTPVLHKTTHPYTQHGLEINAQWGAQELEIGEGGGIAPSLLERLYIDPKWGGLATGWGLDRLVMVRKQLPDIRLLRDPLPTIERQMKNLNTWVSVSRHPSAARHLSVIRSAESEEALVESVLNGLSESAHLVQEIVVTDCCPVSALSPIARNRLGPTNESQNNVVVKIVWQSELGSLDRNQVNRWARAAYKTIHQGTQWENCP